MTLSDTLAGLLLMVLGVAVIAYAATFPPMPGQNVGPSLFPMIVGAGLAVLGSALAVAGRRQSDTPWIRVDHRLRERRRALNAVLVVADLVGYALLSDRLGFFLVAPAFLAVLLWAFGTRPRWILPIAIVVPALVHYGFYTLLHVPLPWGLLERFAW